MVIQKPVPNFTKGREHHLKPCAIVLHVGECSQECIYQTFLTEEKSSHYCVSRKGEIWQFVREEDTAWHAGYVYHPVSLLVLRMEYNPNSYTIGVEAEGFSHEEPTNEYYKAVSELVKDICKRYNIPVDDEHIIPHRAIRSDKECPGKINCRKVIDMINHPIIQPDIPTPVLIENLQKEIGILQKLIELWKKLLAL